MQSAGGERMTTDQSSPSRDLTSMVALVTGASRGVGKGIAIELGAAGATVIVTGRSSRADDATTEGLPGTVEETADLVSAAGGTGVAVRCDHFDDTQVASLFDRVGQEYGRLDLLVNNAWAGYERSTQVRFDAPFWKQPMWRYDLFAASLRAQYLAGQHAATLMTAAGRGLIVSISYTDGDTYLGQVAYDTCKFAANRQGYGMARELRRHGVSVVNLLPGFVRTERVEAAWSMLGEEPAKVLHTPAYVGRAVVALAADPEVIRHSGHTLPVGELAVHYGFTDVDGRQPPPFRLEGAMSLATRMDRLNRVAAGPGEAGSRPEGART
ncbi:SDR family NAD(P)-dependent oxidoreductase [Micromonospora sp. NPDC005220]|uniref:SDR family NAD(P)-dependent oxidoreductase n=1 Tax=Micromonospora sp. NPDC005220 TaxID=3155589 RepID=UPI0033A4B078